MDASTLLAATLSPNAQERENATAQLAQFLSSSPAQYLVSLSNSLADANLPSHLRNAAGLAIKNALSARDTSRSEEYAQRWKSLDPATRTQLKHAVMSTLAAADRGARNVAGQVVASIAAIEVPAAMWPTLIAQLLELVANGDNPGLRQATLQAIGYICESIKPELLASQSNEILTAVVQGARKEEPSIVRRQLPSPEVQLAAVHALYNSLEFVKDNFEREGERNYIMQVVCEATQSPSSDVQVAAFECLVRIMSLYYDYMKHYMERALFGLTVLGMKHVDEQVALQAVEFWSTVCDEEIELALEAEEAAEYGDQPERGSSHFARIALPEVLPVLLQLLLKQEEDATEDEWNVSMAAGTCLALLAQCVGDGIVPPIIPFVEINIKNADWRKREAAVMAFGSILDGPEEKTLMPLVSQALPMLIEMMHDPSMHVRDTTAWTLGRITDVLIKTINLDAQLQSLITALVNGLEESPRIVSNCCWSIMNLAEQLGDAQAESTEMSSYYDGIVSALLRLAEKSTNEASAPTSAYEALSTLVTHASNDTLPTISKLVLVLLDRSEALLALQSQLVGADDRNNYNELQVNICTVLTVLRGNLPCTQSVTRRLSRTIQPLADRIMTLLLQLISSAGKQSPILEDAFLAIGAITAALDEDFHPYLQAFLPFLVNALNSHEEYQLCSIAVGLIGDICRALGEASLPYCQVFMELLLADLQSTVLHRNVKPPIISCFGDIALAVGPGFEPFLETTMTVLQQAGTVQVDPSNYDLIDYVTTLREALLEAYTGIVSGLKTGSKSDIILPYLNSIFAFVHLALSDPDRTETLLRSAIGLIGDIAEAFPEGQLRESLSSTWVAEMLKAGRTKLGGSETKKIAKWAKEMVRRAMQ
ncbi:BQ2448_6974 [Microbotryum intermedium]|uniref:Importin-95 n=1 Tax=Microbotryum intermedium TaxID=269621 RepID=A0A238FJS9_9BASI|nr:BQ2448_6974 [Microbotryum intermedium]